METSGIAKFFQEKYENITSKKYIEIYICKKCYLSVYDIPVYKCQACEGNIMKLKIPLKFVDLLLDLGAMGIAPKISLQRETGSGKS